MWLLIGIDYQYQSIDKLESIGCRLTETELTYKKPTLYAVIVNTFHFNVNRRAILSPCSPLFLLAVNEHFTDVHLKTAKNIRDSSNTRAMVYILCAEKQEIGIVLPVLSPGLPKNGGCSDR